MSSCPCLVSHLDVSHVFERNSFLRSTETKFAVTVGTDAKRAQGGALPFASAFAFLSPDYVLCQVGRSLDVLAQHSHMDL